MGAGINVNPARETEPPGVVTDTLPLVPVDTTASICVSDTTVYDVAVVPPNVTAVAPVKPVPVSVTVVPCPAATGKKLLNVGGGENTNPALVPVPELFVTLILPEDPVPTVAVMVLSSTTV